MKNFNILRYALTSCIGLALLIGIYMLCNTQQGLNLIEKIITSELPGKLTIAQLHGRLLGPIQITDLHYQDKQINLSLSAAQLDWNWIALLKNKVHISTLNIDNFILSIKPSSIKQTTKKQKSYSFDWNRLKHFKIDQFNIKHGLIVFGKNKLELSGQVANLWQLHYMLTLQSDLVLENSQGQFDLQGDISGSRIEPKINTILKTSALRWHTNQLKPLQAHFYLNATKNRNWHLDLQTNQLKTSFAAISPIQFTFDGNLHPFKLQGRLSGFTINTNNKKAIQRSLYLPASQINASSDKTGLKATLITSSSANQLFALLKFPQYKNLESFNKKQILDASIQAKITDFSNLAHIFPEIKKPQGQFNAQINVHGPLNSLHYKFFSNLHKGSLFIPQLGLHLNQIDVQFYTNKQLLIGAGQAHSGSGNLSFSSKTLLQDKNLSSTIQLQGNDFTLAHTPSYQIIGSPKLQLHLDTHQLSATGKIQFSDTQIKLLENQVNGPKLSSDIVFVKQKKNHYSPFAYQFNVKINLEKDVHFIYAGLDTKVSGQLITQQLPYQPLLATGQLKLIDGSYSYYGQKLKIESSSLLSFANSPIENPKLNIRAHKLVWIAPKKKSDTPDTIGSNDFIASALQNTQATQALVGVHLHGYLEHPQITLYADPSNAMSSQVDMLSYLVTGQPSDQLNAASLQLLLQTAGAFAGEQTGINQFINKAQKKIGLDTLTIGSNPIFNPNTNKIQQNTSVIIGKNFSPRLNVSYSLGLLDSIRILQINYKLNKYFSLQATNNNFANGVDLFYKIEKN